MRMRALVTLSIAVLALCGAAPRVSSVPPSADADVGLSDGRVLHVYGLPLGRLDGTVLDGAAFDASGTRIVLLARFPEGAVDGDWRRADPTQAYVADVVRRTLTALTGDGRATAIRWAGSSRVIVTDAGKSIGFDVGSPGTLGVSRGPLARLDRVTASTSGTLVSPTSEFRLQALKEDSGAYAVGQVGAVRLRTIALSNDRRFALVGSSVAWIDASKRGGASFSRIGPDDVIAPTFGGDAYGTTLTPLLPLGHLTYQGAYRNGVAYFAFAYGLRRIVAETSDFVSYTFPALPAQPDYTVGDGMGAGADGVLYFADPENGVVQLWRHGKYVELPLTFPPDVSDTSRLFFTLARLTDGERVFPPVAPDQDALEAAALEWRIYPLGDVTGQGWVASYLGRAYVAGADRKFREIAEPGFPYPFAVLSRTDDGRIWGATIASRSMRAGSVVKARSVVWSSRDGVHWAAAGAVDGSVGAIGALGSRLWVALSAFEGDGSGVEVAPLGGADADRVPTGAIYAGEDLFFADLAGSWYLVCGGAPGTRADDTSGPLVALALDPQRLAAGLPGDPYLAERLGPTAAAAGAAAATDFARPTLDALAAIHGPVLATIVDADPLGVEEACCRWMAPDSLRRFQLEYAWTPYPLGRVSATVDGDRATIARTLERGPLNIEGRQERWTRDASGGWSLSAVLRRWKI